MWLLCCFLRDWILKRWLLLRSTVLETKFISCCIKWADSMLMQQYWAGNPDAYEFIGVSQLAEAFQASGIGSETSGQEDLESGQKKKKHRQPDQQDQGQNKKQNKMQSDQQGQDSGLDPLVHDRWANWSCCGGHFAQAASVCHICSFYLPQCLLHNPDSFCRFDCELCLSPLHTKPQKEEKSTLSDAIATAYGGSKNETWAMRDQPFAISGFDLSHFENRAKEVVRQSNAVKLKQVPWDNPLLLCWQHVWISTMLSAATTSQGKGCHVSAVFAAVLCLRNSCRENSAQSHCCSSVLLSSWMHIWLCRHICIKQLHCLQGVLPEYQCTLWICCNYVCQEIRQDEQCSWHGAVALIQHSCWSCWFFFSICCWSCWSDCTLFFVLFCPWCCCYAGGMSDCGCRYALSSYYIFKAFLRREYIIMKRNALVFSFRVGQVSHYFMFLTNPEP